MTSRRSRGLTGLLAGALMTPSVAAAAECSTPRPGAPILLYVGAIDPALEASRPAVERAIQRAAATRLSLLPAAATRRALEIEGGAEEREQTVIEARVVIGRAEELFRELNDEEALGLLATATAKLGAASEVEGAIELLAHAHLVAGAIYLARGRQEAARARLFRALDLDPELAPARDRFSPELLAELGRVRADGDRRPAGRLVVRSGGIPASVFVDGRRLGTAPLELDLVPAGNHVVRLSARGHTSHTEVVQVGGAEERILEVSLPPDPEVQALAELDRRRATGHDVAPLLALLGRRGGGERVLYASLSLSGALTPTGTATIGVHLELLGGGRAYAPSLGPAELDRALALVLACAADGGGAGASLAPALFGARALAPPEPAPVPEAEPLVTRPWFWAVFAVASLGLAGAMVALRGASGPPESVEVRLVPRP